MAEFVPVDVGRWSLFVQPDGANTDMYYLGCDDLGDIDHALGDITQKFCPDPVNGGWKQSGQFQGEPSPATFDVTSAIGTTQSILGSIHCPAAFYLVYVPCGQIQNFGNWQNVGVIAPDAIKTNDSWQTLRKRVPADNGESLKVTSWSSQAPIEVFDLVASRQSISETEDINAIAACNVRQCQSSCGTTKDTCTDLWVTTDAPAGSPSWDADVWSSSDGGATWTEVTIDPFGPAEDIQPVVCVEIDSNTTRVIVARGTTDAASPAEIAYSDDSGTTWTLVNVGSTNGQYAVGPHSMFSPDNDPNNIWLVTSGGYIYYSSDAAETWTAQEEGVITAGNYICVHGSSENILYAGAAADVIVRSTDGGTNWTAVTATGGAGDMLTVAVRSQQRAWVGTDDGTLWFTNDGGTTWTQRTGWTGSGTGDITAIEFYDDYVGYMTHNDASSDGTLLQTINGGRNWRTVTGISNNGFNDILVCDENKVFVVGETGDDGTGMIIKYQDVTSSS